MKQVAMVVTPKTTKKGMAIMATITKEKAAEITAKFGANEKDTGNVRVQIALLTETEQLNLVTDLTTTSLNTTCSNSTTTSD